MNWETRLLMGAAKSGPLHNLLPVTEFADNQVFLTREDEVGCFLRVHPVPAETLTDAERNGIARHWEKATGIFTPRHTFYQYAVKRANPEVPCADPTTTRAQYIEQKKKKSMFSVDVFAAVCARVFTGDKPKDEAVINRHIGVAARSLRVATSGFSAGLSSVVPLESMDRQDAFTALRSIANPSRSVAEKRRLASACNVDWQTGDSSVQANPVIRIGTHFARVLSMKKAADETMANILGKLLDIPCEMILATEWRELPAKRARAKTKDSKRHYENSESTAAGRADGGDVALADQITQVEKQMTMADIRFGRFAMTIILYSESEEGLAECVEQANTVINSGNGALVELMGKSGLGAWLALFPGNHHFQKRSIIVSNENHADMSLIFGASTGETRNSHLRGEYLAVLENNRQQPFYLNLHVGEVGHTIILGKSGMGKSFLLNFLIENALKYKPRIFIFDLMHGFRALTKKIGGSYVEVGIKGSAVTINPFMREPTESNLAFLFIFVKLLIESDGGARMTGVECEDLNTQIRNLYSVSMGMRRLGKLRLMPSVADRLNRWVTRERLGSEPKVGQYAYLFDNVTDTLREADTQTYNFPEMKNSTDAREALLFYILHCTSASISADPIRPKFLVMDEALQFIEHPDTEAYVRNALMRFRHHNASVILSTQGLSHLKGDMAQSVREQCVTKIFAAIPKLDTKAMSEAFGMSQEQAELIRRLIPQRQFLIQDVGIVNLIVGSETVRMYSSGAYAEKERQDAAA